MDSQEYEFDRETKIRRLDPSPLDHAERAPTQPAPTQPASTQPASTQPASRFGTDVSRRWNIGENPNGGYLASASLRAMTEVAASPDPLSITAHYLRPGTGDEAGEVAAQLIRPGRRSTTVSSTLHQQGTQRMQMMAAFGDLSVADSPATADAGRDLTVKAISIPDPDDCVDRRSLEQGVDLPILDRLDVRIDPTWAVAGAADSAVVAGWIRFSDERPVDTLALFLFADAFPPSVFSVMGTVGWVPTLELTVHVRRRPVEGWIRARFETKDLANGMLVEDGELWDTEGRLVAQSRQLALLLT